MGFLSVFYPEGKVYCEEVSLNFPQTQAVLGLTGVGLLRVTYSILASLHK